MAPTIYDDTLLMFVGDTHGHLAQWRYLLSEAKQFDPPIKHFVQVGDFGYWEHNVHEDTYTRLLDEGTSIEVLAEDWVGPAYLDGLSQYMIDNDSVCYWIDGNHENHKMLRALYAPGGPRHKGAAQGFWEIRPGVIYIPRGRTWIWGDTKFLGMGGAYSVDKTDRLKDHAKGWREEAFRPGNKKTAKTLGISMPFECWWEEEMISEEELAMAKLIGRVDVVLAHDCPASVDIYGQFQVRGLGDLFQKSDFPSALSRQICEELLHSAQPAHWIHGHYHLRYSTQLTLDGGKQCRVLGLSRDGEGREAYAVAAPSELRVAGGGIR